MEQNYELSIKRLEQITALLEDGKLSIDESLKLFSEATEILSNCTKYLDSAEQKITSLIKGE
ncbi:MAG: exodeoxyribonuclease VII small subunit [Ruminococcaceae bacterium]|nr:exodeoxyribonuclease VII small subunit [Oscillospiraceae bacterium]